MALQELQKQIEAASTAAGAHLGISMRQLGRPDELAIGGVVSVPLAGVLQLRLGLTAGFRDSLRGDLSRLERVVTIVSGSIGYVTLGVLSLLVGYSVVRVAVEYDPSEAGGWDKALRLLAVLGEGPWLLGAAAVGLILYGFYFVLLARYRAL